MSIFDDLIGEIGDWLTGGPGKATQDEALRNLLRSLEHQKKLAVAQFEQASGALKAWPDPLNELTKHASDLLSRSSQYAHGIALNYNLLLQETTFKPLHDNIGSVALDKIKHFLDVPANPRFIAVPGYLATLEITSVLKGLTTLFLQPVVLAIKIAATQKAIGTIQVRTQEARQQQYLVKVACDYFLHVCSTMIGVYQAAGLLKDYDSFHCKSAADLIKINAQLGSILATLESVNGNAFMVSRSLVNLVQSGHLDDKGATDEQIKYAASRLIGIDSIHEVFDQESLEAYIRAFLGGTGILPAALTQQPKIPKALSKLISIKPSEASQKDDLESRFAPPDIDWSNIPTAR